MMLVDYAGSIFPIIAHSPWNGVHLADFVMPFFFFVAGVSLALVYKNVPNKVEATWKAVLRSLKLFFLGILLQGGYLHGITTLTFGVDIERTRWLGILQRIAIGYIVAALCELWLPCQWWRGEGASRNYFSHWCTAFSLCAIYLGLTYGLYVPDWQFEELQSTSFSLPSNDGYIYKVRCSVRGDLGPACNAAGMIDRYVIGINHLYKKPVYRNLKECNISKTGQFSESTPSWCHAPFDPEGILRTIKDGYTIGVSFHLHLWFLDFSLPSSVSL
ncbi:unnamed protein product [Ilex paraguariensis]